MLKTLGMVVLRLRDRRPRPYRVPLNLSVGGRDVPVGILLIFLLLLTAAVVNLLTKEVATVAGLVFTAGFLSALSASDWYHRRQRGGGEAAKYVEQFNAEAVENPTRETLGIGQPEVTVVGLADAGRVGPLREALAAADPARTQAVAVIARDPAADGGHNPELTDRERALLTAVVDVSEEEGKPVRSLAVTAGDADEAAWRVAAALRAKAVGPR